MKNLIYLLLIAVLFSCSPQKPEITGELKTWHKVTLTFDGPESSELATPNPFTDYRINYDFSLLRSNKFLVQISSFHL